MAFDPAGTTISRVKFCIAFDAAEDICAFPCERGWLVPFFFLLLFFIFDVVLTVLRLPNCLQNCFDPENYLLFNTRLPDVGYILILPEMSQK